jgi:carboxyl-terminal processing protease
MHYIKSKPIFFAAIFSVVMLFACYTSHSGESSSIQAGQSKNEILIRVLLQGLNTAHFKPEEMNDAFSKKVYDLYMKRLDFNKKFLLQSDIDQLAKYQTQIDDQIRNGSYEFLDASTKLFVQRVPRKSGFL